MLITTLITVYVLGVFISIIKCAFNIKKYCPNQSIIRRINFIMSDRGQLKFTLKSWFYFFNL